jgi:hypothetical protein
MQGFAPNGQPVRLEECQSPLSTRFFLHGRAAVITLNDPFAVGQGVAEAPAWSCATMEVVV